MNNKQRKQTIKAIIHRFNILAATKANNSKQSLMSKTYCNSLGFKECWIINQTKTIVTALAISHTTLAFI
jgi:hypothetical protein